MVEDDRGRKGKAVSVNTIAKVSFKPILPASKPATNTSLRSSGEL